MSRKGFSLVEIMIAIGLVTVLTLGLGSVVTSLMNKKVDIETRAVDTDFFSGLFMYLQSKENCETVFVSNSTSFPFGNYSREISINTYAGPEAPENGGPVQRGSTLARGRIRITSLTLSGKDSETMANTKKTSMGSVTAYMRTAIIKVKYDYDLNPTLQDANKTVTSKERSIIIPVVTNGSQITSCSASGDVTAQEICEGVGGTVTGSQCRVNTQCRSMGNFIYKQCSDSKTCNSLHSPESLYTNPLTKDASCPEESTMIKTSETAAVYSHEASCGKKCTYSVYTTEYFMTCIKCE